MLPVPAGQDDQHPDQRNRDRRQLQPALGATNWTPMVTISNLPAPTLQFSAPATNAAQFYRLERPVYSGFGN